MAGVVVAILETETTEGKGEESRRGRSAEGELKPVMLHKPETTAGPPQKHAQVLTPPVCLHHHQLHLVIRMPLKPDGVEK